MVDIVQKEREREREHWRCYIVTVVQPCVCGRADGLFVHTLNTESGLARKLDAMGALL